MQVAVEDKRITDPNDAYNLPSPRKASSTSLFTKIEYSVDHNELPRVHRTLSNQSLVTILKDKPVRNLLTSCSLDFGSFNNVNISVSDASKTESLHNETFETSSNLSVSSNVTDQPCSAISSISDADENTFKSENVVKELNRKIEQLQTDNERSKFLLNDIEWKTKQEWEEKYQSLLREKANVEGQLMTLQSQYDSKIEDDSKRTKAKTALFKEYTELQSKLNLLEKLNSELSSKIILSTNETKQYQMESAKLETENEKLRIAEQEMKIELDSKNSVLLGLKNKITEQHIEMQNYVQAKLKLNNHVTSLNNEIESVRKSEKWYIEQLHTCQLAKSKLQQQLMSLQSSFVSDNQKIESLRSEIVKWKNACEETRIKAIREKEKLLRKMEMIEADLVEREATYKCTTEANQIDSIAYNLKKLEDSQNEIQNKLLVEEYEERLETIAKLVAQKDESISEFNKEKTDFLIRITTQQKMLNEKELLYQSVENANNDLEMKCNNLSETLRTKDNQLLELRNKIVNLEVGLHAASKEKEEIDEVVKNVRDDFNKFMKCYNNMKETLEEKTKIINNFECEKQELFMENNWRVCKIEELQQKVLKAKGAQAELLELRNSYNELLVEQEVAASELNEKESLKESLRLREEQLHNQMENCELLNHEIEDKGKEVAVLTDRLKQLESSCKNEGFKTKELRDINMELEMKIGDLNKKLEGANYVIEQFNDLCRNSELEKHNLSVQLENIKKLTMEEAENILEKVLVDDYIQTDDVDPDRLRMIVGEIKMKFNDILVEDNSIEKLDVDKYDFITIFVFVSEFLDKIFENKSLQDRKIEINNKVIKTLKNKVSILKNIMQERISVIDKRCNKTLQNYEETRKKINLVYKFAREEKRNCSESSAQTEKDSQTNRVLLQKIKEEACLRRSAEKNSRKLTETLDGLVIETNDLKALVRRFEIENESMKDRCEKYEAKCNELNGKILSYEKEKGEKFVDDCEKCKEYKKLSDDYYELECKFKTVRDKVFWYEKEITDKDSGITECKKQLFNEKLQTSALKKQLSSVQMCLDNANALLDKKQVEFSQLKSVCEKLESSKADLLSQLEIEQNRYEECKRKLEENTQLTEEQSAKDALLADEIKVLSPLSSVL